MTPELARKLASAFGFTPRRGWLTKLCDYIADRGRQ